MNSEAETMSGSGGIAISFTITDADYRAMNRARQRRIWRPWRETLFWIVTLLNLLASAAFIYDAKRLAEPLEWPVFVNGAVGIFLLAWRFVLVPLNGRRFYRKQGYIGKETEVILDENGVHQKISGISSSVEWNSLLLVQRVRGHFLLWINEIQAFFLPFRAFSCEEEREAAWQFVQERMAKKNDA